MQTKLKSVKRMLSGLNTYRITSKHTIRHSGHTSELVWTWVWHPIRHYLKADDTQILPRGPPSFTNNNT